MNEFDGIHSEEMQKMQLDNDSQQNNALLPK